MTWDQTWTDYPGFGAAATTAKLMAADLNNMVAEIKKSKVVYDGIVFIDGVTIKAMNSAGTIVSSGTAGTDDNTVLTAAIAAMAPGSTLHIATGDYANIALAFATASVDLTIEGSGWGTVLKGVAGSPIIDLDNQNLFIRFRYLTFDGNSAADDLIYADDNSSVGARMAWFSWCQFTGQVAKGLNIRDSNVDCCFFDHCYFETPSGTIGAYLYKCSPWVSFDTCWFYTSGGTHIKSLAGSARLDKTIFISDGASHGIICNDLEGANSWVGKHFTMNHCHIEGHFADEFLFSFGDGATGYYWEHVVIGDTYIGLSDAGHDYAIKLNYVKGIAPGVGHAIVKDNIFATNEPNTGYVYIGTVQTLEEGGNTTETTTGKPLFYPEAPVPYYTNQELRKIVGDILALCGDVRILCPFAEVTGTAITDYSRNGHTITASESVATWQSSKNGAIVYLMDGAADHLDVADSDLFSFGDASNDLPFTVVGVISPYSAAPANKTIISKFDITTGAEKPEWLFWGGTDGKLNLRLYDNDSGVFIGQIANAALAADTYQVAIATYDGSKSASGVILYQNGLPVAITSDTSGSYTAMHNTAASLRIGNYKATAAEAGYWYGYLGMPMIVGRALTPDEVWTLTQILRGAFGI